MAETVQKNMELMVKEMRQFRDLKILNDEEIKELLRRRKHYEYKINGITKNLNDYLDYIKYEYALLKLIKIRRANSKDKCSGERKIITRIKRLYEVAVMRFPQHLQVSLDYFKFCKEVKFLSEVRSILSKMIKNHPKKEEVWLITSQFYFKDLKDTKFALKTLRKGLAILKNSKLLFKEIFKVEVLDVVNKQSSDVNKENDEEENENEKMCVKKLLLYFEEMKKLIEDIDVYMEILQFLKDYKFTLPVQKSIVHHLYCNYSEELAVWNAGVPCYDIAYKMTE
ncbi:U3 small nucleolar RNA-associated protein 6 homolog [Onthophagus taurus]|uniref:U3 small nucleolar RNA-associated protein 6 homolog n=1 Tax=Onthophagus taurus TaxID=166361 RepID=UPI000C20E450|nr:U3 small nucleolar RNA-associated protein 6-like [Onthophagus taurus]XP_022908506.1 U3 small nucleolar RNA-associated protein 6-like [Onthophagus taurus]